MKRHTRIWLFTLLALLALALPALPAVAQSDDGSSDAFLAQLNDLRDTDPTYSQNFHTDDGSWEADTDSEDSFLGVENRTYRVDAIGTDLFVWGLSPVEADNFYAEVLAERVGGPVNNEFGMVFRHEDTENFYAFMASSDGFYTLRLFEGGEWSDLIPWTASDAVDQSEGAQNLVAVYADGPTLLLLINDTIVDRFEDETFSGGGLALASGSFDEGGVEIAFDDFALWDLDEVGPLDLPPVGPTEEPTEEPTDEPTEEPTAAPTLDPADVLDAVDTVREEAPTLTDEFRRDDGTWVLGSDESSEIQIERRALNVNIIADNWLGWSLVNDVQAADLLAEVDVSLESGPTAAEVGILYRFVDENNFYYFPLTHDGEFSLWKMVDDEWFEILPWQGSDAIDISEGGANRMSVWAEGPTMVLLINDEVVGQAQDDTFAVGQVGLAVGTFEEPEAVVSFDNFDLWVLAEEPTVTVTPEPEITPDLEVTPEVTETPEPEITPSSDDVALRIAEVQDQDPTATAEFRRDDGTWSLDTDEGVTHSFARRAFNIRVDRDNWVSWSLNQDLSVADFMAEVDAAHVEGPQNAEYGLVFRFVDDNNFYFYATSANGDYSLFKRVDGGWETVVDWSQSAALNTGPGALNRLGVLAEGPSITLIANSTPLVTVEDDSFSTGQIGIAAGTFDEPGLQVSFDNFAYWQLDEGG